MAKTSLTKGIILRTYNAGTADKVVVLLDEKGRRLALLAKSLRKSTSKKAHSIEMGNLVKVKYIEGYSIPILNEVELIGENKDWKEDAVSVALLQMILETSDQFALEDGEDGELFELLAEILNSRDKQLDNSAVQKNLLTSTFLLKVLNLAGSLPDLSHYAGTEEKIKPKKIYSKSTAVGFFETGGPKQKISDRIYKTEKFILGSEIKNIIKLSVDPSEAQSMLKLHANWIELTIEKELKSKKVVFSLMSK